MKNAIRKKVGGKRPGAGRPATGQDPSRTFRLSDEFIASVDAWAGKQEDQPTRSEAVRRLVEAGLRPNAFCVNAKMVGEITAWIEANEPGLNLHEAIGRLVELGLKVKGK